MKLVDFNHSIEEQLEFARKLMLRKGEEYSEDETDRLLHFKKAAALQGISQNQAIFSMLTKHIVSLSDMVSSTQEYPIELWQEKITDSINYLLILKAAVDEEALNKPKKGSK